MNGSPSVTVVVPVRDGAATIGDTLTGLMHQAPSPFVAEILVVDNGSRDATRAIVEKFPVLLLTETTPGPAAARNRGLHEARGAVVAHLDADTLPTRRWLAEIAAPFADPTVNQVAGRMLSYRPSTSAERYYAQCFLDREEENAMAEGFPFAAAGNMAVRRDAALAVGGWDEEFRVGQDVDLSYRLRRRLREVFRSPADVRLSLQLAHFIWRLPGWVDREPLPALLEQLRRTPRPPAADLRASVERIDRLSRPWFATLFRGRDSCYLRSLMFCRFADAGGEQLRIHFLMEPRRAAGDRIRGHAWVSAGAEFCEAPDPEILARANRFYTYPGEDGA